MPRRARIDLAGYHHSDIFIDDSDYEMFLKMLCKACKSYQVILQRLLFNVKSFSSALRNKDR